MERISKTTSPAALGRKLASDLKRQTQVSQTRKLESPVSLLITCSEGHCQYTLASSTNARATNPAAVDTLQPCLNTI